MIGRRSSTARAWLQGIVAVLSLLATCAVRADPITGTAVSSPTWEILLTDFGYADFALDRRPGFVGREYLSGEWATAVGSMDSDGRMSPIWLQPYWFYPDWTSNSDFGVEDAIGPPSRGTPTNAWGFPILRSVVTNRHVRIVLTYEMVDSVSGIAAGIVPRSQSWPPRCLWTDRYVFRQTCSVTNLSGRILRGVRLFQFLHGLESQAAVYDDRDYGGPWGEFHYDLTLQGRSLARDSRSGESVWLHDVLTLHADRPPAAWETGYYGRWDQDSHITGKPSVGVHWSVETNALSFRDWFEPPEGRYVSGALAFDLGDLEPGQGASCTFLLTVATWRIRMLPVRLHAVGLEDSNLLTLSAEPGVAEAARLGLATSAVLTTNLSNVWRPVWRAACVPDPVRPGCSMFQVPLEPDRPVGFYRVETWLAP